MIIQNPLLKHWVQRHKLPINVENFEEDLYLHGPAPEDSGSEDAEDELPPSVFVPNGIVASADALCAPADSGSEDREDEIPPCVPFQDGIVASADALEQGNLITPTKVGRTLGDNFVERAKRQKGCDNVADPTSDSHKFVVRIHLLKAIMKYHVDVHKKTWTTQNQRGRKTESYMPSNFKLTKKAEDLDGWIAYFLKTVKWFDCIFKNQPSMRKLNCTFFRQWLEKRNDRLSLFGSEESKIYVAKVFAEMAHGLMDHLSVNFVAAHCKDGGLEYEFRIRAQVVSLDMYDRQVMRFRSNRTVADWVFEYANDLENFIVEKRTLNPEAARVFA